MKKIIDFVIYLIEKLDPYIMRYLTYLRRPIVNRVVLTLIVAGCTLIATASSPVWFPFAVAIFEQKVGVNVSQTKEAIDWVLLFIGVALVVIAIGILLLRMRLDYLEKNREKTKNLLLIQHCSIESVTDFNSVKDDLSKYQITPIRLDQTGDMKKSLETGIEIALEKQSEIIQEVKVFITKGSNFESAYMGLAHIPLVFLMGYQMADKCNPDFFEWNQNDGKWEKVTDNNNDYPKLKLYPNEDVGKSDLIGDIAIKIGITYPIDDSDLLALNKDYIKVFYLKLDKPERNTVKSKKQLLEYKKIFRELLDAINQNYLGMRNIHIFYSGQPSLAFVLGSALSERMDANVYVYNHNRNANVRYAWSLKMFKRFREIGDVFHQYGG